MACSPTASASLLDNFPDNGLFFRTIPSDSLQAIAIVEAVNQTGANTATVAYIDDDYGQLFAESIGEALATERNRPRRLRPVFGRQQVDQCSCPRMSPDSHPAPWW